MRIIDDPVIDVPVDVWASPACECLLALHCATQHDEGRAQQLEIGAEWFNEIRTSASPRLRALLASCRARDGAKTTYWFQLMGLAMDAPLDVPSLLERLRAAPPDDVWRLMLGAHRTVDPDAELLAAIADAGHGRVEPLRRLLARDGRAKSKGFLEVVRLFGDPATAKSVVIETLERWYDEAFRTRWPELQPFLEGAAEHARRLGEELGNADLVEHVTNGMEHVAEAGVDRLLLVPTYVGRPWVYRGRHLRTLVYVYPVGEDVLAVSPQEARQRRLLRVVRALGDETRLRALHRLAEQTSTLQELADALGIRKSLMHHHLAVLRSAGLLRVHLGLRYSLRTSAVGELSLLLGAYLGLATGRPRRRP
jgi:DNA-binding transcriptional ArsR family regulator